MDLYPSLERFVCCRVFRNQESHARTAGPTAFEFVIINTASLAKKWQAGTEAADFARDAGLVCPQPPEPAEPPLFSTKSNTNDVGHQAHPAYPAHLLPFPRSAPARQVSAPWRLLAQQYMGSLASLCESNLLSTSGEKVAWLHFRLDDSPKYSKYLPFIGDKDDREMSESSEKSSLNSEEDSDDHSNGKESDSP
eukprot:scaffold1000_cov166-Amphora_coffeaeformis.AAC.34